MGLHFNRPTTSSELSLAVIGACLALSWCAASRAQAPDPSPSAAGHTFAHAHTRTGFLDRVTHSADAEVEMGRLADARAQSAEVKSLAQMLVADFTRMQSDLKSLADQKSRTLPGGPGQRRQAEAKSLGAKSGAAFDAAYVDDVIHDHDALIKVLESETESSDHDLADFARREMPALQQHEGQARKLSSKPQAR